MENTQPVGRYNPKQKLLLVTLLVCVFFVGVFWAVAHVLVDEEAVAEAIKAHIENDTGLGMTFSDVTFSPFPSPQIQLKNVAIKNDSNGARSNLANVDEFSLGFGFVDILTGGSNVSALTLYGPSLNLENSETNARNWDAFGTMLSLGLITDAPEAIKIIDGRVVYTNTGTKYNATMDNVNAIISAQSRHYAVRGDAVLNGEPLSFESNLSPQNFESLNNFTLSAGGVLRQEKDFVRYDGVINNINGRLELDGDIETALEDAQKWFSVLSSGRRNDIDSEPEALSLKAKATTDGSQQVIDNITFSLGETDGIARVVIPYVDEEVNNVQIQFRSRGLASLMAKNPKGEPLWKWGLKTLISSQIPVQFDIGSDSIQTKRYGVLNNIVLQATLADKEMVINKAEAKLAGDSSFFSVGLLHLNARDKLQYDGNVEISGKRFNEFTAAMGIEKERFFIEQESEYRARAELFLSEEQLLLSGGKFRAGDFLLAGSVNKEHESDEGTTITIRAKNFRADALIDAFIPKVQLDTEKMYDYESFNRSVEWLSHINERYMIEMVLEDYIIKGKRGKRADLKVIVENGVIDAKHVNIEVGDVQVRGALNINQKTGFPNARGKLSISKVDLASLVGERVRTFPVERGNTEDVWSQKNIDFNYLKGYDLDLKLHVKKMSHQDFELNNFYGVVKSKGGLWHLNQSKASIWDGSLTADATLDLTSVPIFSGRYAFKDIRAEKLVNAVASHKGVFGTMSLSGTLGTNGMNPLAWVQNAKSNISFNAYGVVIKGFDLASVIRAIPSVRNVGDVVNVVRLAVIGRKSSFKEMRGTFNVEDGIVYIPEVRLRSQHTVAAMSGQMDIVKWMINMQSRFALTTLSPDEQPALAISFSDSIDDPVLNIDTREIEKFVAKRKLH